jgi:hypothetical protein
MRLVLRLHVEVFNYGFRAKYLALVEILYTIDVSLRFYTPLMFH